MFKPAARLAAAAFAAVMTVVTATTMTGGVSVAAPQPDAGPDSCPFITELIDHNPHLAMKNAARIIKTKCGYRYRAGQQNSHLVITQQGNKLRFVDRRTDRIDVLAGPCTEIKGVRGIAAKCRIPSGYSASHRMLIEVWPRLGNDFVDGSKLSDTFSMTVLADGGNDTALLGAGPDFFNGAFHHDRVRGGAGDDWIRTGDHRDRVNGGPGSDYITGGYGDDTIVGGEGVDRLYCGPGRDRAFRDGGDSKIYLCESVSFS